MKASRSAGGNESYSQEYPDPTSAEAGLAAANGTEHPARPKSRATRAQRVLPPVSRSGAMRQEWHRQTDDVPVIASDRLHECSPPALDRVGAGALAPLARCRDTSRPSAASSCAEADRACGGAGPLASRPRSARARSRPRACAPTAVRDASAPRPCRAACRRGARRARRRCPRRGRRSPASLATARALRSAFSSDDLLAARPRCAPRRRPDDLERDAELLEDRPPLGRPRGKTGLERRCAGSSGRTTRSRARPTRRSRSRGRG